MRPLIVAALALAACRGRADKPAEPAATGSLVFDPRPGEDLRVFMATEAEVIRSAPLIQRVRDDLRTDELTADAIAVARKPDTLILDVSVHHADPLRAAELCNALLRSYFEYRLERRQVPILQAQQVIGEQLDKTPDDTALQNRLKELELERNLRRNDVRLLDACKVPRPRAR